MTTLRSLSLSAFFTGALVASGCAPGAVGAGDPSAAPSEIKNGVSDTAHPQVAQIYFHHQTKTQQIEWLTVSGVLVGPHTVVTAAQWPALRYDDAVSVNLYGPSGTTFAHMTDVVVADAYATDIAQQAARSVDDPAYDANAKNNHALALVYLDRDVTDVAPAQLLQREPVAGDKVSLVGFGVGADHNALDMAGVRQVGSNDIDRVQPYRLEFTGDWIFQTSGLACGSDVGGAVFIRDGGVDLLAGVNNFSTCESSILGLSPGGSTATRVDTAEQDNAQWIADGI